MFVLIFKPEKLNTDNVFYSIESVCSYSYLLLTWFPFARSTDSTSHTLSDFLYVISEKQTRPKGGDVCWWTV